MRYAFWRALFVLKFQELYLEKYLRRATRIDTALSIAVALISAGSVSAWVVWQRVPLLWSSLVMLMQILQIVKPFLPYARRAAALRYFIPEQRALVLDAEMFWLQAEHGKCTDDDYITRLHSFRKQYLEAECKYLGSELLPKIKRLMKSAEAETENHLRLFFGAPEGDD